MKQQKDKGILEVTFESCVRDMQEKLRKKYFTNGRHYPIHTPKRWLSQHQVMLERMFISRCKETGVVVGDNEELKEAFGEFLQKS